MRKCLYLPIIWLLASCEQQPRAPLVKNMTADSSIDLVTAHTQIKTLVEENFVKGFRRQDSMAMAENYAYEGVIMPPNSPVVRGHDAATYWLKTYRSGITDLKITSLSLTGDREHLVETGTYQLFHQGTISDRGKYLAVWKPFATTWKMMYDIWNSDMPDTSGK